MRRRTASSRELFKTVIDGEATGVFQGKIIVPPRRAEDGRPHDVGGAAPAREGGAMNNKPELEIFADDVECAHGATCGALDEDLLFYLGPRPAASRRPRPAVQAFLGEARVVENERPGRADRDRRMAEGAVLMGSSCGRFPARWLGGGVSEPIYAHGLIPRCARRIDR